MGIADTIDSVATGVAVQTMTGSVVEGSKVAGFAAFIQSITGEQPTILPLDGNRARVVLSKQQHAALTQWIHAQIWAKKEPGKVQYELGPTLKPLALQYVVPAALIFFLSGYLVRGWIR